MANGVYFGTGDVAFELGHTNDSSASTNSPGINSGDTDLSTIDATCTIDVASYTFTVTMGSKATKLNIAYQFGSEEYPDFVGSPFDDAFGFFVSGPGITGTQNLGKLPNGNPTSINKVNVGTPGHYPSVIPPTVAAYDGSQSALYINNGHKTSLDANGFIVEYGGTPNGPIPAGSPAPVVAVQFNGLTKLITYNISGLTPGGIYTFKIAIGDNTDNTFDSGVFINQIFGTADVVANNDSETINVGTTGTVNVLTNDSYNSTSPVTLTDVTLSQVSTTNTGVNINTSTGLVTVAAGTPAGVYTIVYQICDNTFSSNCKTATMTVTVLADSDGDGIVDAIDLDDDNDGILDTVECTVTSIISEATTGPNITSAPVSFVPKSGSYSGYKYLTSPLGTDGIVTFTNVREYAIEAGGSGIGATFFANGQRPVGEHLGKIDFNLADTEFSTNSSYNFKYISVFLGDFDGTSNTFTIEAYDIQDNKVLDPNLISVTKDNATSTITSATDLGSGVFQYTLTNPAFNHSTNVTVVGANEYPIERVIFTVKANNSSGDRLSMSYRRFMSVLSCADTDGDGIPNYLDLDSDNDGCPDAIEGGDNIINSQLVNSSINGGNTSATSGNYNLPVTTNLCATQYTGTPATDCVGSTGVPTLVNQTTGQTVGSSANNSILSNACKCFKTGATGGTVLDTNHGITVLGRAGADNGNWPMIRKGAWTALEAKSKGFVINRVHLTADLANITPAVEGMMVYDEEADCLKIYTKDDAPATTFSWRCFNTQTCPDIL